MSVATLRPLTPNDELYRCGITSPNLWHRWQEEWRRTEGVKEREARVKLVVSQLFSGYPWEYRGLFRHTLVAIQILHETLTPLQKGMRVRTEACVAAARLLQGPFAGRDAEAVALLGMGIFSKHRGEAIYLWQLFLRRSNWNFEGIRSLLSRVTQKSHLGIHEANLVTYAVWKGRGERHLHVSQWPEDKRVTLQNLLLTCIRTHRRGSQLAQVIARLPLHRQIPEGLWQWRRSLVAAQGTHVCVTRLLDDFTNRTLSVKDWIHSWREYRQGVPRGFGAEEPWHRVLRYLVPDAVRQERALASLASLKEKREFLVDLACSYFRGTGAKRFPVEIFAFARRYRGDIKKSLVAGGIPDDCTSLIAEFVREPLATAVARRVHFEAAARAAMFGGCSGEAALSWLPQIRPLLLDEGDFSQWLEELRERRNAQLLRIRRDGHLERMPDFCSVDGFRRSRCMLSYAGTLGSVVHASVGVVGLILGDPQLFDREKLAFAENWIVDSHDRFAASSLPFYGARLWLHLWWGTEPPFKAHPLWPQLQERLFTYLPPVKAAISWMGPTWEEWQRGQVIRS